MMQDEGDVAFLERLESSVFACADEDVVGLRRHHGFKVEVSLLSYFGSLPAFQLVYHPQREDMAQGIDSHNLVLQSENLKVSQLQSRSTDEP